MIGTTLYLFSLDCGRAYGEKVAGHLGTALSDHEERDFEDSEYKVRPLVNVRDGDVFVVQSLHGDGEPQLRVQPALAHVLVVAPVTKYCDVAASQLCCLRAAPGKPPAAPPPANIRVTKVQPGTLPFGMRIASC